MAEYPPGSTRERGHRAEELVQREVEATGLSVVARNVEAAGGEIDLIARGHDGAADLYIFIEVRSRTRSDLGMPIETVGATKRRHLVRAATSWLVKQDLLDRVAVRFDVVGVNFEGADARGGRPTFEWIEGAFEVDGPN